MLPVGTSSESPSTAACVPKYLLASRMVMASGMRFPFEDPPHCTQPPRAILVTAVTGFAGARSTLDHVHGQAAARRFLVLVLHVTAGVAHGLDDLVERDAVLAVAAHRHPLRIDRLHRPHRIALDAGNLHQPADGIAGEAEVVFHADLGSVLDLVHAAAERGGERAGRHRTGYADLALAADFRAADRGVLLVEDADRAGGQEKIDHALLV